MARLWEHKQRREKLDRVGAAHTLTCEKFAMGFCGRWQEVTSTPLPDVPSKGKQSLGIDVAVPLSVTLAAPLPPGAAAGAGPRDGAGEGGSEIVKRVVGAGDGASMPAVGAEKDSEMAFRR